MHDTAAAGVITDVLLTALAALSVFIWVYILAGRGAFWIVSRSFAPVIDTNQAKKVVAVVPARNEVEVIGEAISSLLSQDFEALAHIIVVDDASTDGTDAVVREVARRAGNSSRVTVLRSQPLATGWTGKLWALSQGVEQAIRFQPDYLLLTDADILHSPQNLRMLVNLAETKNYDLVSLMVKLSCQSLAEKALVPAFVFFFLQLYPPAWIRSTKHRTAGAAGGCVLVRPAALLRAGGLEAIRNEVIDDCALAREVKRNGGRLWMGLTRDTKSIRSYGSFAEIGRTISRTAFSQLKHSNLLLLGTIAGLFLTFFVPPIAIVAGNFASKTFGSIAWFLMAMCYLPMVKFYGRAPAWSLALPVIALFYAGATVRSAILYWIGRGGQWKDRAQDASI